MAGLRWMDVTPRFEFNVLSHVLLQNKVSLELFESYF